MRILVIALLALVIPTTASASTKHGPGDFRQACFENHTISWYGSRQSLVDFLASHEGATEGVCPVVPVVPVVPEVVLTSPSDLYLCYSKFGVETNPAVFPRSYALWLWGNKALTGQWFLPVAVPGNIAGGDNVGAYHIACNPASTRTATGKGLGGSGDVYDAATKAKYDTEYTARDGADFQVWAIFA